MHYVTNPLMNHLKVLLSKERCDEKVYDGIMKLLNTAEKVDSTTENKTTLLMLASLVGDVKIVDDLVKCHADVNAKNKFKMTALAFAINEGHFGVAKYLIDNGANINEKLSMNRSLLMLAIERDPIGQNYIAIIDYLIKKGANVNHKDLVEFTPLMSACESIYSDIDVVKLLVDRGANINVKNKCGTTALDIAAEMKKDDVCAYLMECKAK